MSDFQQKAIMLLQSKKFKKLEQFLDLNSAGNLQLADEIRLLSLVTQGKPNEVIERPLDNYLAKYKDHAPKANWVQAARLKFELKKYDEAMEYAAKVLATEDDPAAAEIAALCCFNKQEFAKGYDIVSGLLKIDSSKPIYREWQVLFAYKTGKHREALDAWDTFESLGGELTQKNTVIGYVARCFMKFGDMVQTRAILEEYGFFDKTTNIDIGMLVSDFHKLNGDLEKSLEILQTLHTEYPEVAEVKWNLALANLNNGDLKTGWSLYECRWDWVDFPSPKRTFDTPSWSGEDLNGKKILVWGEQGIGDQIRFLTLLPELYERFPTAEVTIEIDAKCIPLIKAWYPEIVDAWSFGLNDVRGVPEYQRFDYQLPSGSLPKFFFNDPERLLQNRYRTLKVTGTQVAQMYGDFAVKYPLRIGVSWRSMMLTSERRDDYLNAEAFRHLIEHTSPNVGFVVLQYAITEEEKKLFEEFENVYIPEVDFLERVDLNALYAGSCELLLSCGTVVATLAGIFGVPVVSWSKTDDPVNLGQEQNPWFPNRFDFRIQPGWDKVTLVDRLSRTLEKYLKSKD